MRKALALAALVVAALSPTATAADPVAEQNGSTCSLSGVGVFSPGLTATPGTHKFEFAGKLRDCRGTGGEKSGKISAAGVAKAGCIGGTAKGTASIKWNNGKTTSVRFETVDVTAGVFVYGTATKSTAASIRKGDRVFGALAFEADPTQCNTAGGVKKAPFDGQVGGGSPV